MSDVDDIAEYFNKMQNEASCFSALHTPEFVEPELDIKIDPDHFIDWLKKEDKDFEESKSYAYNVSSMCEYSCLYIAMLFHDKKLKGDLRIVYGKYGWWEHYWMKYTLDGVAYYLDLTLQQFVETAPKFSISLAKQNTHGYNSNYEEEAKTIEEYVNNKMGFEFYVNPNEVS